MKCPDCGKLRHPGPCDPVYEDDGEPDFISPATLNYLFRFEPDTGNFIRRFTQGNKLAGTAAGTMKPSRHKKAGYEYSKYCLIHIGKRFYKRSRLVFLLVHGRWPTGVIDHINGDTMDDRPENLREATIAQNARNRVRRKARNFPMGVHPVSGYPDKFQAAICFEGKQRYLGIFDSPEAASAVYQAKRKELFGEFA